MDQEDFQVPELENGLEYHCFIAFSYEDEEVAVSIQNFLQSCGLKVAICREFELGRAVVDNIKHAVDKSRRALLLLSKDYLKSHWYDYETLLFIHNSYKHKRKFMVPVILGRDEELRENIESYKNSRLNLYNYIEYDDSDPERSKRIIAKSLVAPDVPMSVSLPAGNVAQGLVWSFYYGYLNLILPGLRQRCEKSPWWNADAQQRRMVHKTFILIPSSGLCHSMISECDPAVQVAGKLESFEVNRAGVQKRKYDGTIYQIADADGTVYYAPCEYATPVLAMYEMAQGGLAGLNNEEKEHQILEFKNMLDQVLSHGKTEGRENFKIIFFKDEGGGKANLAPLIITEIKKILEEESTASHGSSV